MWHKFKMFMIKVGLWLWIQTQWYRWWSKIYQFVWERKNVLPLRRFESLNELVTYISLLKWRADSWREIGDAISSPMRVQWLAENEPGKFIGDCDEFGHYEAAVINNELENVVGDDVDSNWWNTGFQCAYLFTVVWLANDGETGYQGHNVCLIQDENLKKWRYMDYGYPSRWCDSIDEVSQLVCQAYNNDFEVIAWVVSEPWTLKRAKIPTLGRELASNFKINW